MANGLISRVGNVDCLWHKTMQTQPLLSSEFDLTLDTKSALLALQQLNFIQLRGISSNNLSFLLHMCRCKHFEGPVDLYLNVCINIFAYC